LETETSISGYCLDNTISERCTCRLDHSVRSQPVYSLHMLQANRLSRLLMLMVPKSITRSILLAMTALGLALFVAGCSSGISHSNKPTTNQALQPGAGAPSFCKDLASNTDVSNLPQTLRAVATSDSAAVARLKAAAAALRMYAADGLGAPATKTADALDALATSPQDQTALNNFVSATTELDARVRTICHTT
jgi:hypothetical protein